MANDPKSQSSPSRRYALTAAPFVIGAAALYNWVISPHVGYLHAVQRLEPVMGKMAEELDAVRREYRGEALDDADPAGRTAKRSRKGSSVPEESKTFLRDLQALVDDDRLCR